MAVHDGRLPAALRHDLVRARHDVSRRRRALRLDPQGVARRRSWGARASWYYWINFPLWMASLAVVCPELLGVLTGLRFGWGAKLLIELAFIWVITWIACYPVCDSILILNISAAIKMLLALTVGVLGIVYVARSGFVNDMAPRTFLPGFDLHSLSYISVIIFNFLGFEVVCTYADNMRDPKRQIPQAIVERRHRHRAHLPVFGLRHRRRHPHAGHQRGLRASSTRCRS
ncbi:MAG: APC family permease [Oscillospiraceae bacterium]